MLQYNVEPADDSDSVTVPSTFWNQRASLDIVRAGTFGIFATLTSEFTAAVPDYRLS